MIPQSQRIITIVIAVLVVGLLAVVATLYLLRRQTTERGVNLAVNRPVSAEVEESQRLIDLRPLAAPDERILLFGDSLVTSTNDIVRTTLEKGVGLAVEIDRRPRGTSRDAIVALTTALKRPPKFLILDVGRYDSVGGISEQQTVANLRLIFSKTETVGSVPILVAGISSDGNARFADLLRPAVGGQGVFVDAALLLLTSSFRTSATELNDVGAQKLAEQLLQVVKSKTAS